MSEDNKVPEFDPAKNPIKASWEQFRKTSVPKTISAESLLVVKVNYMAGVAAMLRLNMSIAEMNDDAAMASLENALGDVEDFNNQLRQGREYVLAQVAKEVSK